MLGKIRKIIPKSIKDRLRLFKIKLLDNPRKRKLGLHMQHKHKRFLSEIKGKEKVKVLFLVLHKSVWKVDPVFREMLEDPLFEPEILVCPYITYGEVQMLEDMEQAFNYFKNKGYSVTKSLKDDGSWVTLKSIQPDVVFFTNPYKLTMYEYYENAYLNYLSCYVPYYYMATKHAGEDDAQFNSMFLLSVWKVYWAHDYSDKLHKKYAFNYGVNGFSFGYPATENLYQNKKHASFKSWKSQESLMKKVIFSPHHTIEDSSKSLSSFLEYGEYIKELAIRNKDKIQWSFKPHSILKSKLYLNSNWGKDKTDAYYSFWDSQPYTQLDNGEYDDLFLESDAIIHDCSSFIVEYAFTRKPCLYLVNKNNLKGLLNEFGEGVMQTYFKARNVVEIESFIDDFLNDLFQVDSDKRTYFDGYVDKFYRNKLPSQRIVEDIKQSLGVISD